MKDKDQGAYANPYQAAKSATPCQGNFVSFTAPTMVLENGGKNTDHAITSGVRVTGKASSLTDLKAGDIITLIGDPATEVQVSH